MQNRLEVNQQVAAADQFDMGKGGILDQVVLGKYHHFTDIAHHLEMVIPFEEILIQQTRGQIRCDTFGVKAAAGLNDSVTVHIGGKYLHIQRFIMIHQAFAAENGQGIGFFTGRAPDGP